MYSTAYFIASYLWEQSATLHKIIKKKLRNVSEGIMPMLKIESEINLLWEIEKMLAGTVYFYKNNEVVYEMDMEDYDDLSEAEITSKIEKFKVNKIILIGFSHNHQFKGSRIVLYEEKNE